MVPPLAGLATAATGPASCWTTAVPGWMPGVKRTKNSSSPMAVTPVWVANEPGRKRTVIRPSGRFPLRV